MASQPGAQGLNPVQQFPGVMSSAPDMDLLPLRSQVSDSPLVAGFEAATGQDHGPDVDVHEAFRCLRPYALDMPLSGRQQVDDRGVVDHVDAPPLGGAEQ